MSLFLAYDGTINGDWVSHYAVRMASADPSCTLRLTHVGQGDVLREELHRRIDGIRAECERFSVAMEVEILTLKRNVFETLTAAIAPDDEPFVVFGTRARAGQRGFLAGSVGERFLKTVRRRVLILRVLHPGLLGAPHDVLLPVASHPRGISAGLPIFRLLAPSIKRIHILNVKHVGTRQFGRLTHVARQRLRRAGHEYCLRIERELGQELGLSESIMDIHTIISDDVPKDIIVHANRLKSQLIYMGASERSLAERLFYGNTLEQVLRDAPCDVAIYGGLS